MITALVSGLLGAITGILPDALKIWSRMIESKAENELLKISQKHEILQSRQNLIRLKYLGKYMEMQVAHEMDVFREKSALERELSYNDLLAEDEREYTKRINQIYRSTESNIRVVEIFNSLVRPVLAAMVMLLFLGSTIWYLAELASLNLEAYELLQYLKGFWQIPLVELSITGPISFLFAQRQVRKRSAL